MKNIIKHPQFGEIRTKQIKKQPWFVAKDVCDALGLTDVYNATKHLDESEKGTNTIRTLGGNQEMIVINESGLYQLIFKSRKEEAKQFTRWVTSEVLPSIRKYGFYSTDKKVIDRAEKRQERKNLLLMLSELSKQMSATDERAILKQSRIPDWHLENVLKGRVEDVSLVAMIYARVTSNRRLYDVFYGKAGVQKIINELVSKK